jgi:DNA-binding MarR family transcriptional regulator
MKSSSSRQKPKSTGRSGASLARKPSEEERRLTALLDEASTAVLRYRARELAPAGISAIEAAVLHALVNATRPTTPAEISRWINRGSDATSRLIQRMQAKGLVNKSKDLDRGNLVRVSMTDKGREAYDHSRKAAKSEQHPMAQLSPRQKAQLEALLKKMLPPSRR